MRLINRDWERPLVDRAMSVAQLIRLWTWLLAQDLYRPMVYPDGDARWLNDDWERIPEFVRYTGLA